jgi:phospholipase D1/2
MSIHLATKGGTQGKQGYLRVLSPGASRHKRPGFHPIDLKRRHEPKWFIVRESYIVAVDEVFGTQIWDVFLLDSDFKIERPNRLYRQGIGLFSSNRQKSHGKDNRDGEDLPGEKKPLAGFEGISGGNIGDPNDPSTTSDAKEDPQHLKNTSAHTFYIKNSERKVKLVAKSERQMDQFIASIEKMTQRSIWAGKNRFGSFSPIRMNVAAQWLVDGRDYFWNLSRAILLAKHSVYIHDWWLSPELVSVECFLWRMPLPD